MENPSFEYNCSAFQCYIDCKLCSITAVFFTAVNHLNEYLRKQFRRFKRSRLWVVTGVYNFQSFIFSWRSVGCCHNNKWLTTATNRRTRASQCHAVCVRAAQTHVKSRTQDEYHPLIARNHLTFPVAPWDKYSAPSCRAIWTWRRAMQGLAMAIKQQCLRLFNNDAVLIFQQVRHYIATVHF